METVSDGNSGLPAALRSRVLAVVARHLSGRRYRVHLFGSRARGTATPRSDYDLALQADAPLDFATLARIRAELDELPVLQRIELVDLAAASTDFVRRALEGSELLDDR